MPEQILFPEFRPEQEFSRYPFVDSASLQTYNTAMRLENDTFLDASLYPIGGGVRMYISQITVAVRSVTVTLTDATNRVLCRGTFDPLDPPYVIPLQDAYARPAGILLSEPLRLAVFAAWPVGDHQFRLGDTEFVAGTAIPTPETGVRGLLTEDNELLAGDVWLVGDRGIVVRADGDEVIRIDIVGDPLFVRRLCFPVELFEPPVFLKTINGCPPDANGNFSLTVGDHLAADTVLRIYPTNDGLKIEAVGQKLEG